MKSVTRIVCGLALCLFALQAQAADSYKFQLWNKSTKYNVTGFQTYEDGKWSTWSGVALAPGEDQTMDWQSNSGNCTVPFKIMYAEYQTEQYSVDWCKVKNIYVTDSNVTYD